MRKSQRGWLALGLVALVQGGCVRTWGAPAGDDYELESNAESVEDEEAEDAWDDANR